RIASAYRYLALGGRAVLYPRGEENADYQHPGGGRSEASAAGNFRPHPPVRNQLLPLPAQPGGRHLNRRTGEEARRENGGTSGRVGRQKQPRRGQVALRTIA